MRCFLRKTALFLYSSFLEFDLVQDVILSVMKIHHYTAVFREEPEGGYTVIIPALPGCVTWGETIEHAADMAKEAIESYLGSLAKDNEEPPGDIRFVSTIDVPPHLASNA